MHKLKKILMPLKRKILMERALRYGLAGFCCSGAAAALFLMLSKFIIMPFTNSAVAILIVAGGFFGVAAALIQPLSLSGVAKPADTLGFKERFTTALELQASDAQNEISRLVMEDVERHGHISLNKIYKIRLTRKEIYRAAALLLILTIVYFLPSSEGLILQRQVQASITDEVEELKKKAEELSAELTKKDADILKAQTNELLKELRQAKTKAETIKAMEKAQQELKKLSNNSLSKDMKKLGQELAANENTKSLGEALESGDFSQMEKELNELNKFLETASKEDLEKIAEILAKAAEELASNPELAESLQQASDAISKSDGNTAAALDRFGQNLEKLASENAALRESLDKMQQAVGNTSSQMQGQQQAQGQTQGQNQGQGQGQQQGQGQNPAQGQGQEQGQAQGQGQGQGQSQNQQAGSGRGTGHIASENIYRREAANIADYEAEVSGVENEAGETSEKELRGMGDMGGTVAYEQVLGEYRAEALRELTDYDIPHGMRELVKEYFSTLE